MNAWLTRAVIGALLLVALFFGAILLYVNVIRADAPDELDAQDLAERVSGTTTPVDDAGAAMTIAVAGTVTAPPATPGSTARSVFDGRWVATAESVFGYRVEEILFGVDTEAVGRGNDITGALVIAGPRVETAAFAVDVASILSDDERRDAQFRGRIMEIERFPDATFTLTQPIDLGVAPAPGETVTASATGDLTLHGVTRTVTFEVTAEAGDGRFGVLGAIPVVFADFEIENPSRSGITTEDHGLVEFVLVFEPA